MSDTETYCIPPKTVEAVAKVFHDYWWPLTIMSPREADRYKTATEIALRKFLELELKDG